MALKNIKDVAIAMKAGTIRTFGEQNAVMRSGQHLTKDEQDARMIYALYVMDNKDFRRMS